MDGYIKVKEKTRKTWKFLTSCGNVTKLRVHAARMTVEKASELVAENAPDNPEWDWKIIIIPEN